MTEVIELKKLIEETLALKKQCSSLLKRSQLQIESDDLVRLSELLQFKKILSQTTISNNSFSRFNLVMKPILRWIE
jgi:hypothetical protein